MRRAAPHHIHTALLHQDRACMSLKALRAAAEQDAAKATPSFLLSLEKRSQQPTKMIHNIPWAAQSKSQALSSAQKSPSVFVFFK